MAKLNKLEQIGCDRISFRGAEIKDIDFKELENKENVRLEYCKGEFAGIRIRDEKMFHCFSMKRKWERGTLKEETALDICIGEVDGNNMRLWSIEQYKKHLTDLGTYFRENYGIDIDFKNTEVSAIEISCNCNLQSEFSNYQRAFNLIFQTLPKRLKTQLPAIENGKQETFLAKNKQRTFTIYDKNQEMLDKGEDTPEVDIARIEYRLKTGQKVRESFGTAVFADMTDAMIQSYFMSTFRKEIENGYQKWCNNNRLFLKDLLKECKRKNTQTWQYDLLEECRNTEQGGDISLLDVEDLLQAVKEVDKNYKRVSKSILKKMRAKDYFQTKSGKKIEDVIERVELIYQMRNSD